MVTIILVFLIITIIFSTYKKPIYGLMFYYGIRMIVPSCARIFDFSFSTISFGVFLLCSLNSLIAYYKNYRIAKKYVHYILFLLFSWGGLTFLANIVPLSYQWSHLIQTFYTEFSPSVVLLLCVKEKKHVVSFCNLVALFALFTALYGLYTYFAGSNPIFDMFNISGAEMVSIADYANGRGGLSSIAVGIYGDKIALSLVSMLLLNFLVNKEFINRPLLYTTLSLTFIDMLLTTQRSALFCSLIFFIALLKDKKSNIIKKYWKFIFVFVIVFAASFNITEFTSLIKSALSMFSDAAQANQNVSGSSVYVRFMQLSNIIDYLGSSSLLCGAGFAFASYYYSSIWGAEGLDTDFYGFESYIFKLLSNSGIIGLLIWCWVFVRIFKLFKTKNNDIYYSGFFLSYISVIIMTDASCSLYLFLFLLILNFKCSELLYDYDSNFK